MKKLLSMLIALTLVASMLCVFSACDDNGDPSSTTTAATTTAATTTAATTTAATTTAATTGPIIPSGYKLFSNDDISFAYPSTWAKDGSDIVLLQGTQNTNNITVAYEDATDIYEDLTTESFEEEYVPIYELMGMTLTNVKVSHKTTNGLDVVVVSYTATINGESMKQTQYVTTVGEYTYTVTVTEVVSAPELVENVFNTLTAVK